MRQVFDRVLREATEGAASSPDVHAPPSDPAQKLDEQRQIAAQDLLYAVLGMLQRRGLVRRARMTLYAIDRPTRWEARLVADAYRRRKDAIGEVRVFVTVPRQPTDVLAPARVRFDWALKAGGVWYTQAVEVPDPAQIEGNDGIRAVLPALQSLHRTINGSISIRNANRAFTKIKKRPVDDRLALQGLRLV